MTNRLYLGDDLDVLRGHIASDSVDRNEGRQGKLS